MFLISTAHNTKVYEKGIIDTSNLRNVSVKDYIIPKLAVIGIDMFLEDKSCSMLICMTNLTFLQNEDIKSCVKTENITICGEFTLSFEQGTISHVNIADQNLHARLHTHQENGQEISEGKAIVNKGYENGDRVNLQNV